MRDWWKSGLPASASLRTYGAGAVIVLIFGAILADASDDASLILWCLFSVGGYLSVVILSVLIRHPLEELPVSVRQWATFVVLIASGPITVTIAIGIAGAGGVSVSSPRWDALLLSSVALAFWLVVGARLSCSLSVDDRLRQELLQELAREKALALESQRLVEGDRDRLIEDARQMMSRRLRAFAQEDSSPNAMAGNLRILIDESIRPLSRTLHAAQVREDELVEQVAMMRVPAPRPLWSYLRELHRVDRLDWLLVIGSATVSVVVTALGFTWALPAAIAVIPSGSYLLRVKFRDEPDSVTTRAVGGTISLSGLPLMYVDFVNQMKQKDKYNLNMYVTTNVEQSSDCSTSTNASDPCEVYQSGAIELNAAGKGATNSSLQTKRFAYLLPVGGVNTNADMTFGFYLKKQNCVGKCSTFLPNFNAGVHGTSCGKLDTPPSTYMTSGSRWTVYLQKQTTGYNAFLDGPNMPASKKSKKYPNGCVFAVQTEFDNAIASLGIGGWLKVFVQTYKDVMAVSKLIETDGADGKKNAFKQFRKTWGMIAGIPNPPDWADMGACKQMAKDVNEILNNRDLFAGMVLMRDPSTKRTSVIYGNAECTVPDKIYGATLGLVSGMTVS